MNFVIGLGNPGISYHKTRHNAGFLCADFLQENWHLPEFNLQSKFKAEVSKSGQLVLAKPQEYMNRSGESVRALLDYYDKNWEESRPLDQVIIMHDDLDIPFGSFKIQQGTGPKIHNGLLSIHQHLSRTDFTYVRIGVDARNGDRSMSGSSYVLAAFSDDELTQLGIVFQDIAGQLSQIISHKS